MHPLLLTLLLTVPFGSPQKYYSEKDVPELRYLDPTVDPCDDFYKFSCGNFDKYHSKPGIGEVSHFTLLQDKLIEIAKEILLIPEDQYDPLFLKKTKAFYRGCVREDVSNDVLLSTIEKFGGMPLITSDSEKTVFSWNDIGDIESQYGIFLFFKFQIVHEDNTFYIIINRSNPKASRNLKTPREKSYEETLEESFKKPTDEAFDTFLDSVAKNLIQFGNVTLAEMSQRLKDVKKFINDLNDNSSGDFEDYVDYTDPPTVGKLQKWTIERYGNQKVNWRKYLNRVLQKSGLGVTKKTRLVFHDFGSFQHILNVVLTTKIQTVKNYCLLRIFLFQAADSDAVSRKAFEDYSAAQDLQVYPRWEYCIRKILDFDGVVGLSHTIVHAYQRNHYNINKIGKSARIVQNIRTAIEGLLRETETMGTSNDDNIEKVGNMLVLLAYPEDFHDDRLDAFYENFRVCEWDNYGNARTLRAFKNAYQYLVGSKNGSSLWDASLFQVNAYYNNFYNHIVIPISMLNPVFLYGNNPILDYSRFGTIIGHELTHSLGNQDTPIDFFGLDDKSSCFSGQYSGYYVPELDKYVSGFLTKNENKADDGGIRASFKAFKKLVQKEEIKANGSYTLEQLFFMGFATTWCSEISDKFLEFILSDVHPPARIRIIETLSNVEEFSEAFNCPVGSKMNPINKCSFF